MSRSALFVFAGGAILGAATAGAGNESDKSSSSVGNSSSNIAGIAAADFAAGTGAALVLTGYVIHQLGAGAMDEVFRKDILRDALKTVIDQLEIRSKVIDANVCVPSFQSFSKFFSVTDKPARLNCGKIQGVVTWRCTKVCGEKAIWLAAEVSSLAKNAFFR